MGLVTIGMVKVVFPLAALILGGVVLLATNHQAAVAATITGTQAVVLVGRHQVTVEGRRVLVQVIIVRG